MHFIKKIGPLENWGGTFYKGSNGWTKGNGFKVEDSRSRLDMRKKVFTVRLERDWNWLLREVVDAPLPGSIHS